MFSQKETQVDKKVFTSWGQVDHLHTQQLAWTHAAAAPEAREVSASVSSGQVGSGLDTGSPESSPTIESKPVSPLGAERRARLKPQELNAILGPGTSFHGSLSFSGRVRIDGKFHGQLLGGQLLVIGADADIQGEIQAERVVILGGNVQADISATDGIELYVPAHVTGDLRAPEIHLDRGVKFQGRCDLSELPPTAHGLSEGDLSAEG